MELAIARPTSSSFGCIVIRRELNIIVGTIASLWFATIKNSTKNHPLKSDKIKALILVINIRKNAPSKIRQINILSRTENKVFRNGIQSDILFTLYMVQPKAIKVLAPAWRSIIHTTLNFLKNYCKSF